MRKRLRVVAVICCGLPLLMVVALSTLYWAFKQEPEFYREAIKVDPDVQRQASDQMLQQAGALASDVRHEGQWHAIFTAEQINGWLAVDLIENHPHALPRSVRDPRVAIEPDRLIVACRLRRGGVSSVVTLTVEPYLLRPNVLALRICKARAGLLPAPLTEVLDHISEASGRMDFHLQWRQAGGDPVALISIPPLRDQDDKLVQIETLRLGQGEIYLAGTTRKREVSDSAAAKRDR